MAIAPRIGKVVYGGIFIILLPVLLTCWAWRLDQSEMIVWAIPLPPWVGASVSLVGLGIMLVAMHALWTTGKGLPMNAYPPQNYVAISVYALLYHPIYTSFVCMVGGVSILLESPAGFWIVTPIAALASVALVVGYEGPRLKERFGDAITHSPILSLPKATVWRASLPRRIAACTLALCPWAITYSLFSMMPTPNDAHELRLTWENSLPAVDWMIWVYSAAYPFAVMGPLLLRTNDALRRYVIAAWLASLFGFMLMLIIPGKATLLPLHGRGFAEWLIAANRTLDAEWLALPSFHVVWTVLASYCFASRFPRLIPIWVIAAVLVGISCVLTGVHSVFDVLAGAALGAVCWDYKMVWSAMIRRTEWLGNSWSAVQLGSVRIINHALWSALAASSGMGVAIWLAGPEFIDRIALIFVVALVAAGAWGYWLEGGNRLSRPFGYYGFLLGAVGALSVLSMFDIPASHTLMAALACGAPLAQAIGRVRCLIQGCCHGRPVESASGICVTHPESRVTALGGLVGREIHPTPLYSIIGNLLVFACLWRVWHVGAPSTLIGGLYLIFTSLARFVEEQYRGEPQTLKFMGLAIYQWLAIFFFVFGIFISMIDGTSVYVASIVTMKGVAACLITGLITALSMSVDFPNSQLRFSRLTVQRQSDS